MIHFTWAQLSFPQFEKMLYILIVFDFYIFAQCVPGLIAQWCYDCVGFYELNLQMRVTARNIFVAVRLNGCQQDEL